MTNRGVNGFPGAEVPYASKTGPLNWGIVTHIGPITAAASTAATPAAANRVCYHRLVDGGTPISKARVRIAVQSGNLAVAYYANTGFGTAAQPGTLLATSGIVACGSGGAEQTLNLGATVSPGAGDWVAIWADNTTIQLNSVSTASLGSSLCAGRAYFQDSATSGPPVTPGSLTAGVTKVFEIVGIP